MSKDILIKRLPIEIQKMIMTNDLDDILFYFLNNDISDTRLAYYLSVIGNEIDSIEFHEMVGSIYHFHFNYIENAYDLAYYHYWRALEISDFEDSSLLNDFLMILDEPDFDMICKEHINFVANKLIKLNPDNKLAGKYLKRYKK